MNHRTGEDILIDHTTAESNMIRIARLRERLVEADENVKTRADIRLTCKLQSGMN